jgi:hypothetical protein
VLGLRSIFFTDNGAMLHANSTRRMIENLLAFTTTKKCQYPSYGLHFLFNKENQNQQNLGIYLMLTSMKKVNSFRVLADAFQRKSMV